jgi:hypothetical protein
MLIYSNQLHNGWSDNWSYIPNYPTNNPIHSGSNSMALVPSGTWEAWWLKSDTSLYTSIYTNVSFWLNGGTTGGQSVEINGELNGSELPGVWVTAPTNNWQQFTFSLAELGIANATNLTGFQIGNGDSTQPFFIDDMQLVAAPAPAVVHVNVLASQAVRTVSGRIFGINQVAWDGDVETPSTIAILNDMGNPCMRWPGGSWGDGYHWTNEAWMAGASSARNWGSFSSNFIAVATNTQAQAFIIVNYGSSTADEAAYGVRMFNITNHCNFKYWEVGNEVGGSWELDENTNPPWMPHDPWTYAMRFTNYYAQMKAADPTIKIGAVADITEDGTANYTNHPVVNPVTGVAHNGWTPVMLTYMRSNNCLPDFLIEHKYGPTAGDTQDLLYSQSWASDAVSLRQMLTDYLGDASTNVTLECSENGLGGDKQTVSLPGGLFYADTIGQILQTEFNSRVWWDLRNGASTVSDPDPAFYGWRTNSSGQFITDGGIVYGLGGVGSAYPTYYVAKLMPHFAADGDTVVPATSDYPLLAVYSVKRTNGNLTLLVINKSSASNLTAAFNLPGYPPYTNATVYSYGIPEDTAAETGVGSQDIQTNITSFQSLSLTFARFSASVVELSPGNQPPFTPTGLTAIPSNAAVALTWSPATGADSYIVQRSTMSGGGYTPIASGLTATAYLDTGLASGTTYYYVVAATNSYGVSSNSVEASATPMGPVPSPWQTQDIGTVGITGNAFYGNGVFSLTGAGADIQGTSDAFRFAYVAATGNCAITACVVSLQPVNAWSKAGVMIRQSLAANDANAFIAMTPSNGVTWQYRSSAGGGTSWNNTGGLSAPYWVKLTRTNNTFAGYCSPDGTNWTQQGTMTNVMSSNVYVGLALSSHNSSTLCTATFDNVTVPGWPTSPPPAAPTGLTATSGDAQVGLSWNTSSGATSYHVKCSMTSGGGYTTIATNTGLAFTNTGLVNGTTRFYVVSALDTFGESTNSAEVSARPTSSSPVAINVTYASGQLQFSWPADHAGWLLQSQTNSLAVGLSTNWVNVASSDQTNQMTLLLNAADGTVFFRLVRPY